MLVAMLVRSARGFAVAFEATGYGGGTTLTFSGSVIFRELSEDRIVEMGITGRVTMVVVPSPTETGEV